MRSLNTVFTSFFPRIFVLNVRRPAYRGCNTHHRGCCQCQTIREHLLVKNNSKFATLLSTNFHASLGSFWFCPLFYNIYNIFGLLTSASPRTVRLHCAAMCAFLPAWLCLLLLPLEIQSRALSLQSLTHRHRYHCLTEQLQTWSVCAVVAQGGKLIC